MMEPRASSNKRCVNPSCGRLLAPKRPNESQSNYVKRKFCSHKCSYVCRNRASRLRWNGAAETQPNIRETKPAATEAEWLALNGDYTRCPTMYAAPVEHAMAASYANGMKRRGH